MTMESSAFDLGVLVRQAVDLFRSQAAEKRIRLLLEMSPQAEISVAGDAGRLRQVLVKLLSNGVKFTHSGEVLLTVARRPSSRNEPVLIEFSVSDTGIGIPASQLASIFEDFTQVDPSTTRKYGGTGLGLSICRRIVTLMGGQVDVESIPGDGSTFSFSLPFQQLAAATTSSSGAHHVPILNGPLAGSAGEEPQVSLNILIAEDNDKNQKLLKAYLAKTGHVVTVVEDGMAAVEKVEQQEFDLIVMDVRMPKMDGLTATRAIRERERRLGIGPLAILALTADAGVDESERSLSAGCNAHLTKPISKGTLLSAIRKHGHKRASDPGPHAAVWPIEARRASNS